MIIYRVSYKHDPKVGPFALGLFCLDWSTDMRQHPSPWGEEGISDDFTSGAHYCGCKSLDQLEHWFSRSRWALYEQEFILRIYECADALVLVGKYQVVFPLDSSLLLEERELV